MFTVFGCILTFLSVVYLLCCSLIKKFECKKVIITAFIIISISIIFIYYDNIEEISIKDYLKIKIAKKQAYADLEIIDKLKTQMENDANELIVLKAKLDSVFTFGPESITLNKDLRMDKIESATDGGFINIANHPLATSSSKEGGSFSVGSTNILEYYGTGDGAGGIKNKKVALKGNLDILDSDNGIILTSSNGSKWLLKVKNSGELEIIKL